MSMVHASMGKLEPASPQLRSEPAIVAGIAAATLPHTRVPWEEFIADYDRIRDAIESVFPDFKDFNQRIRKPGGFRLPLAATERVWLTPSGKAEFKPMPALRESVSASGETILRLATVRSHDQYNTTIYSMDDRYRGIFGRRDVVFVHAADLAENGIEHGDLIDVETALPSDMASADTTSAGTTSAGTKSENGRRLLGYTAIAYDIARGSVAAYYPEANCLVPLDYHDPDSGTPAYKSVPVRIRRSAARSA
jgi:anaerobic selenocysteine-containing dehydrogenase